MTPFMQIKAPAQKLDDCELKVARTAGIPSPRTARLTGNQAFRSCPTEEAPLLILHYLVPLIKNGAAQNRWQFPPAGRRTSPPPHSLLTACT